MKVAVTGAAGFVGGFVVNELQRRGHAVRVLSRRAGAARSRFNLPVSETIGEITRPETLPELFSGCDAVVHLVGIIDESEGLTFDQVHREGVENVVRAAVRAGSGRLLHMSAMGASADAPSEYGRTKAGGEKAVRESPLAWTIFRPSLIFGPGDGFVSRLARVVRLNPGFVPVIGPGTVRFLPVSVRDVARLFADALEKGESARRTLEVGGPEIWDMNGICREIASALGKPRKPLVHLPVWYGRLLARVLSVLPHPPLTVDQLRSLSRDNVADISATTEMFGPCPRTFAEGIREYLRPPFRHDATIGI
jgi:uncharacterized protein YbjT (DUF2867 family)